MLQDQMLPRKIRSTVPPKRKEVGQVAKMPPPLTDQEPIEPIASMDGNVSPGLTAYQNAANQTPIQAAATTAANVMNDPSAPVPQPPSAIQRAGANAVSFMNTPNAQPTQGPNNPLSQQLSGPTMAPTPTAAPPLNATAPSERESLEAEYRNAVNAEPEKQPAWKQALWFGLQGIQRTFNPAMNNQPMQWLGEARKEREIGEIGQRMDRLDALENRGLDKRLKTTQVAGAEANTQGAILSNDERQINNIFSRYPWLKSGKYTDDDVKRAAELGINIKAGDFRGNKQIEINGILYNLDADGVVTRAQENSGGTMRNAPVSLQDSPVATPGGNFVPSQAAGAAELAIGKQKIITGGNIAREQIETEGQIERERIKGSDNSGRSNPTTTAANQAEYWANEAQKAGAEAEQISADWVKRGLTQFEIERDPNKKKYDELMKKANKYLEKAKSHQAKTTR